MLGIYSTFASTYEAETEDRDYLLFFVLSLGFNGFLVSSSLQTQEICFYGTKIVVIHLINYAKVCS